MSEIGDRRPQSRPRLRRGIPPRSGGLLCGSGNPHSAARSSRQPQRAQVSVVRDDFLSRASPVSARCPARSYCGRTGPTRRPATRSPPPVWTLRAVESPLLWLPLPQSHFVGFGV